MGKIKNIFGKNSIHSEKDITKKCLGLSLVELHGFIISLYLEIEGNAYHGSEILTDSVYLSTSAIGLSQSCSSPECRIKRIQKTLKSSLLLSNRVFIDNPLEGIINAEPSRDTPILRYNYYLELCYLYYIANLLDAGVLTNLPRWVTVCKHCKKQTIKMENKVEKFIWSKKKHFYGLMKDNFTGSLKFDKDHWELFYEGNLNLIPDGHPLVRNMLKIPSELKQFKNRRLTFNEFIKFGHPDAIVHNLINNAILYLPYKSRYGLNALVTNELEASVFNQAIMGKDDNKHEIPFISFEDIDLDRLIMARCKQPEDFQNFRKEINKIIKEIRSSNETQADHNNVGLDVFIKNEINKSLNRLNTKVKHYTGNQLKKALQRGLVIGSILGIGVYTGTLPVATQLLTSFSLGFFPNPAVELFNRDDVIRNDSWYFYWKLAKGRIGGNRR